MEAMLTRVLGPGRDSPAHSALFIRPQSPFLSVLEDNRFSGLYRFTEIVSFLDVRANPCHLEGPKYIPVRQKIILGLYIVRVIRCSELSGSCV